MEKTKRVSRRTAFEYGDDRSRELVEVFNSELGKDPGEPIEAVLERTVNHASRRFWVSEERALRVLNAMKRDASANTGHALKREMYDELRRRCEQIALEHPDWTMSQVVCHAVSQEAPKFYLSASSAHAIICKERVRCARERLERLRRQHAPRRR